MNRLLRTVCLALCCSLPAFAAADENAPKVQIAILLDTSSSMDGLIGQTREQLWKIVNTFANAKREGKPATLELALYQYGNDRLNAKENFIQQVVPLTTDLDRVSEALFALRTNGGEEYCGAAIQSATRQLKWSEKKGDLKLIYIAGNEPFTQGPVNFKESVKSAIGTGIVVNTIYAGQERDGVSTGWLEGAKMADGNYFSIDQNRAVARIDAPQDAELVKLSNEMNKTYIGYGRKGDAMKVRQAEQDSNARGLSASAGAARAMTKSSARYDNGDWDIVDAKKKGVALDSLAADELPAEMKDMKPAEREAYVAGKEKERAEIQQKIQKLSKEREAFIAEKAKAEADKGAKTVDKALLDSVQTQAAKAAFSL